MLARGEAGCDRPHSAIEGFHSEFANGSSVRIAVIHPSLTFPGERSVNLPKNAKTYATRCTGCAQVVYRV